MDPSFTAHVACRSLYLVIAASAYMLAVKTFFWTSSVLILTARESPTSHVGLLFFIEGDQRGPRHTLSSSVRPGFIVAWIEFEGVSVLMHLCKHQHL
jgi:hypothetical protein